MKAIIVDDEPKAIELLQNYLVHFKSIKLINTFRNGLKAIEYLSNEKVDIVFLDINMPNLSGVALSKLIPSETKIIFTTAYSEYAVESYEVNAVDYLLKPIGFERFTKAVNKVLKNSPATEKQQNKYLIKSGFEIHSVELDDILYLKKEGNYMMYFLPDKKILARESITEALDKLPENFQQVHKSYIINLDKIDVIHRDEVEINGKQITVGTTYQKEFRRKMKV
ncbi:MAG: LytTR family DNA-binding domain-containing protein [Melioribacteraceae bacterium]|nr:LytTR family DNA-binding domain-containing protein [Melioribacteraceae bacterium]MCF8263416.1 LytTR family DNA-binding domain-containing protein [Melioribacteraceae bacterium]MCF8414250.1 LytTR family DNA-binding domain-containing protein [Melioribacteraceae bacterium]MCF8430414.1 LytTR family DNA-binding domain-containing protein [Melioribacteraceae bacterium]